METKTISEKENLEKKISEYTKNIDSDSFIARERAIVRLGEIGNKDATLPLVWALKNDEYESNRKLAAIELGNIRDKRSIPYLIEALDDEFYEVRRDAAEALGVFGEGKIKPALKELINKRVGYETQVARKSLRKIAMREIKDKTKENAIFLGLIGGMFLGSNKVFAGNSADLTSDSRQVPVQYYKVCFDVNKDKWIVGSVPLGKQKDNSAYILGWTDSQNDIKLLQGNIATKKGNLNLGLQATKMWINEESIPSDFTLSVDLGMKDGGLASLINLRNLEKTKIGARANLKDITAYFTTALRELEPMFGVSYNGKVTLDLTYQPEGETYFARVSKGINTNFGTVIPELRAKYNDDGQFYGIGIGFIPK